MKITMYHPATNGLRDHILQHGLDGSGDRIVGLLSTPPEGKPDWVDLWEVEVDEQFLSDVQTDMAVLRTAVTPDFVRLHEPELSPSLTL